MPGIFLYGTLLDPVLFDLIAGPGDQQSDPALLPDHTVLCHLDQPLPALVKTPGQTANGILLRGLGAAQLDRLDAYELPFGYTLSAIDVLVAGQTVPAMVYFPTENLQLSDQQWSLGLWEAQLGPLSRLAAAEIAAIDPPLSGAALGQQWHMIQKRAGAKLRAGAEPEPARIRRDTSDGDVIMHGPPRLSGNFFRLAGHKLTHETFGGGQSATLEREVLLATDAALVLPYDPQTDRVLLVEQFRTGPWARGAQNPWSLEPVAGMIDAGETPEAAGLREAEEEAGLTNITLKKMFAVYASPGGTTDYFYCYAGLCSLPEITQYSGGLDAEHEDLRLHVLPFDDAFALIKSGEANIGPLVAMLLWLDRERRHLLEFATQAT